MISESCNASGADAVRAMAQVSTHRIDTWTEFENLLLHYRGFIDLNSADSGQLGWGNVADGGFFSKFFAQNLGGLRPGGDWTSSLDEIANDVNRFYQQRRTAEMNAGRAPEQMIRQTQLTPQVFTLQVRSDPYNASPGTREFTVVTMRNVPANEP